MTSQLVRQLRRSKKLLTVIALGGIFYGYRRWIQFTESGGTAEELLLLAAPLAGVALAVLLLWQILPKLRWHLQHGPLSEFGRDPQRFDHKLITVTGTVVHVMSPSVDDRVEKALTHAVRSVTGNQNRRGRHSHRRILLAADGTIKGELILIVSNLSFEEFIPRRGERITCCGEYLHQPAKRQHLFRKKVSKYGRIHFTHEPNGFLRRVG